MLLTFFLCSSDVFITLRSVVIFSVPQPADAISPQDIRDNFQKQVHCSLLWDPCVDEISRVARINFSPTCNSLGPPPASDRLIQCVPNRHKPPVQVGSYCNRYCVW